MRQDLLKIYDEGKDVFGDPQIYKGVELYPILMKDLKYQDLFYQIFAHPKNYIPNIEILKSSYLKFLVYFLSSVFKDNGTEVDVALKDMMSYITRCKLEEIELLYQLKDNRNAIDSVDLFLKVKDVIFTEDDFEALREIILQQNNMSIEYVESYNPELEDALRFINKDNANLSLADQVFTFCVILKTSLSEARQYSLFQFSNLMEKLLTLKEYDLYKPLLVSGQVTLKSGEIKHYLYHSTNKKNRYDAIFIDKDAFMEKNKDAFGAI
jgi:hypothetical protein